MTLQRINVRIVKRILITAEIVHIDIVVRP